MARTSTEPAPAPVGLAGLTAAAQRIDPTDREAQDRYRRRRALEWQLRAFNYNRECGELWFATEFVGNCFSRIRLVAGQRQADGSVAVAVPPTPDEDSPEEPPPPPPTEALAAQDHVDRLRGASGGHGEIMRGFGRNLSLVGDCNLVGRPGDTLVGEPMELWEVWSIRELVVNDLGFARQTMPAGATNALGTTYASEQLPDDSFLLRVWRPDVEYSGLATSPVVALLDRLEELAILSRMVRAQARSRIANAGILVVPSEVSFPLDPAAQANGQQASQVGDPFLANMLVHFMTPVGDEASASAVVPFLIKLPGDYADKVRHFAVERPIDAIAIEERKELLARIANGLDLPREVLTGLADVNHWNAWQIDEATFRAHLEPLVVAVVNSLTAGYLRPMMAAQGLDPADYVVWYDPTDLVVHPDRATDAATVHGAYALSDKALRRYHRFPEEDAPSAEEKLQRMVLQRGPLPNEIVQAILAMIEPLMANVEVAEATPPMPPEADQPEDQGPGNPGPPGNGSPPATAARRVPPLGVVAAGRASVAPARLGTLGRRLANIDRGLLTRLQLDSDAAVRRAVERAGNRLRTRANAVRDAEVQGLLRSVANAEQFTARLGPARVAALGLDDAELLANSLDAYEPRFMAAVARAQGRALADVADVLDLDDADLVAVRALQDRDRQAAWGVLLGALGVLARGQLYDPTAGLDTRGEVQADLRVPAGVVREAMARAGGAEHHVRTQAGTEPAGGVATGAVMADVLAASGVVASGYVWQHGDADRPYEPHELLDGVQFATWDDPVLAAPPEAEWLSAPYLFPGDHRGCTCLFVPLYGESTAE